MHMLTIGGFDTLLSQNERGMWQSSSKTFRSMSSMHSSCFFLYLQ